MSLSPCAIASLGYAMLVWDWRNSVMGGGAFTTQESLSAVEGLVGVGAATRRDSHLGFFGAAGLGGTGFAETITEGFDNDVFHRFALCAARIGLRLSNVQIRFQEG
jgi:hypothetical protein